MLDQMGRLLRSAVENSSTIYLGIDTGAEGAIGLVAGKLCAVVDIPTAKVKRHGGTKTVFVYPGIIDIFRRLRHAKDLTKVALEVAQVQVRGKGSNAYTGFRVGVAYGLWPLFLASKGYAVEEVNPSVWKKEMGVAKQDKEFSRMKALSLFPKADLLRKKDHNRAEALLLAEWFRRRDGR